jgi:hypothetical protein
MEVPVEKITDEQTGNVLGDIAAANVPDPPKKKSGTRHVWMYMDPARLQSILANCGSRSQLLTYIRLRYAA